MKKHSLILVLLSFWICFGSKAQERKERSLNGPWKLVFGLYGDDAPKTPGELKNVNWTEIPAKVPGNVELDLLAAGIIKNPETGKNIYDLRKYEAYQWWYWRSFATPDFAPGERVEIVFDGIDCIASLWINGTLAGKTDNMFVSHTIDITGLLNKTGENTIHVCLNPAVIEGRKYLNGVIGTRMDAGAEGVNIRKAPHMYGWDIMPRLVSAGLWRDVTLKVVKSTRFRQVYWMTNAIDLEQRKAHVLLDWEFTTGYPTIDGLTMEVSVKKGNLSLFDKTFPLFTHSSHKSFTVDNVDFWWPRGYGDPNLYDASVKILDQRNNVLDEKKQKIGFRTAELILTEITTKENPGEFVFLVNGEKIFVRGTNWVPLDALHSRDKQHLPEAIRMIADLNCNMIRCWGGNVYEDHDFFDLCDTNGIMVWQDFAMGCTMYPQNREFADRIREEAVQVVLKLRNHPSLVLWSGNNENDASTDWVVRKKLDPGTDIISREVLPRVIWEFDPIRNYLPSSPYYSPEYVKRGKDGSLLPEVHLWGPRGYYKASFYTDVNAHFVSEIGYHGCPNRASLEKMFTPGAVYPWTKEKEWNDEWQAKAVRSHPDSPSQMTRNNLMINQVKALFGECPDDLDRFIFASQAVQAEAMKFFIEMWRMDKFRKTGIIWWNLRDGWPIISDAIVDYYNSKKLAYYFIRRVQHNACVMISDPVNGVHRIMAVNDTRGPESGTLTVREADSEQILFSAPFSIPANGKTLVGAIPETGKQTMYLIEYTVGKEKYSNHYLAGKAPFNLDDYIRWMEKLNIKRD